MCWGGIIRCFFFEFCFFFSFVLLSFLFSLYVLVYAISCTTGGLKPKWHETKQNVEITLNRTHWNGTAFDHRAKFMRHAQNFIQMKMKQKPTTVRCVHSLAQTKWPKITETESEYAHSLQMRTHTKPIKYKHNANYIKKIKAPHPALIIVSIKVSTIRIVCRFCLPFFCSFYFLHSFLIHAHKNHVFIDFVSIYKHDVNLNHNFLFYVHIIKEET